MSKALLAAIVLTGLFTLAAPNASAGFATRLYAEPTQGNVAQVDYRSNGHHWHHRSMRHGHWHYWN